MSKIPDNDIFPSLVSREPEIDGLQSMTQVYTSESLSRWNHGSPVIREPGRETNLSAC